MPLKDGLRQLAVRTHSLAAGRESLAKSYLRLFRLARLLPDGVWKNQVLNSLRAVAWPDVALPPVRVNLAGSVSVSMVPHAREFDLSAQIYRNMRYEHQVVSWLRDRHYDIVIEIGANVGIYTLLFSRMWQSAEIYCFEPSRKAFGRLLENLALNDCANVFPFNCAVAAEGGFASFYEPEGHLTNGSLDRSFAELFAGSVRPTRVALVNAADIGQLITNGNRDKKILFKIDAEGTEPAIVRSLEPLIAAHRPDILIEVLPTTAQELGEIGALQAYRYLQLALAGPKERTSFTTSDNRDYVLLPN